MADAEAQPARGLLAHRLDRRRMSMAQRQRAGPVPQIQNLTVVGVVDELGLGALGVDRIKVILQSRAADAAGQHLARRLEQARDAGVASR